MKNKSCSLFDLQKSIRLLVSHLFFAPLFSFLPSGVYCQDLGNNLSPWSGNFFEFRGKMFYDYASSNRVNTQEGTKNTTVWLNKTEASLSFMPLPNVDTAIEMSAAQTNRHSYNFEKIVLHARHFLLNDLAEDEISLSAGVQMGIIKSRFLRDFALIDHGPYQLGVHAAVGKEFWVKNSSYFRSWALALLGAATKSSCWTKGEFHLERILSEKHTFGLFCCLEQGLGSKKLHSVNHFKGYGHLQYSYIDLGVEYGFRFKEVGTVRVKAQKRAHARFCPEGFLQLSIALDIPFGL